MTHLVWMVHKFVSSKSPTRYTSHASCSPIIAAAWICISVLVCLKISYTSLWNGHFLISNSVLFWYLHISLSASSWPPSSLLSWWIYWCFLGTFLAISGLPAFTVLLAAPSVPFLVVCLVLAIIELSLCKRNCTHALFVCLCACGLVIPSTCQSYWTLVSKWILSNDKEATLYPS